MRAARLLQTLLILQNRGRQTCAALASTLEVSRRTILRDIDALTEAGLPVIVHRGNQGGVELGFGYRTRLTGLDAEEAEAMGLLLSHVPDVLVDLGMAAALGRAQAKLREAFPDQTRAQMTHVRSQFPIVPHQNVRADPRREALSRAVRARLVVRLRYESASPVLVHPLSLNIAPEGWFLQDGLSGQRFAETDWGHVNLSARTFAVS
jgi:predicted DNA-binding transcriptional regulator YafY